MTDSDADSTKLQMQLAKDYRQLSHIDQKIVQLFSVIYEPINRTSFMNCLNQIGTLDENNKPFINKSLSRHIDGLLAAGLLVQSSGQGPKCHPLITEIATRDAVKAGYFEILATSVSKVLPISSGYASGTRYFQSERQFIREVRIGFYRHDPNFINKQIEDYQKYSQSNKISVNKIFEQICNNQILHSWSQSPQKSQERAKD
ncbi:hypothetical protein [Dendronalium sp. ChiSLP03b]|uniref:hypothetical protein n=1 Tax=Dendronalium sp. ChiSLP03b TaxID=3075381 RepID=UPI00391C87CD